MEKLNDLILLLRGKYGIEFGEYQYRSRYDFEDMDGFTSYVELVAGFNMNNFTVSLCTGRGMILEPYLKSLETIDDPEKEAKIIYKTIKELEKRAQHLVAPIDL